MHLHLGKKIKALLESRNDLTIKAFSEKIGITDAYAYKVFKQEDISTELLKKIADVLGVPVAWFFTEEKPGVQVANGHGNKQLINSHFVSTHPEQDHLTSLLALCEEKVKGLERENQLLRELNEMLKAKKFDQ